LVGKPFLIRKFKYLRAAANLVGILVGEVPSAASAFPSRAAAFMGAWRKSWMVCGGGDAMCAYR
ncbi:MAG: hypothetical protein AL399_06855, partial [Candidatus [Bacteroides] periocalifornicus]